MSSLVEIVRQKAQGISPAFVSSLLTRRSSMKKIMLSVVAVMCLAGFSSLSFAADMGKMKDEMKGEMKEMKGEMKGDMKGDMKGEMKDKMKAKHDEMKGDMKGMKDEMKGEMKGKMGEMGK
jgi:Sec-independent protein translocase protein TatA